MSRNELPNYHAILTSLNEQEGVIVVDTQLEQQRFTGKKGIMYKPAIIRVAPEQPAENLKTLRAFSEQLIDGVDNVYRYTGEILTEQGKLIPTPVRSFDVTGERAFSPILVEVFISADAAQKEGLSKK